jgi:cytochrome c556
MSVTRTMSRVTLAVLAATWAAVALAQEGPGFKEIMQGLAEDMNRLNAAIFAEDFDAIERSAAAIAHHPRPSPQERQRLMDAVGRDVELFRSIDQSVHGGAEEMADAARVGDMDGVLRFHGQVMQGCVACHAEFRPRLAQPDSAER